MKQAKGLETRKVGSAELTLHLDNFITWNWEQLRFAVRILSYREKYLKPLLGGIHRLLPLTMMKVRMVRPERIVLSQYFKNFFLM
jgi:hypothetical protein